MDGPKPRPTAGDFAVGVEHVHGRVRTVAGVDSASPVGRHAQQEATRRPESPPLIPRIEPIQVPRFAAGVKHAAGIETNKGSPDDRVGSPDSRQLSGVSRMYAHCCLNDAVRHNNKSTNANACDMWASQCMHEAIIPAQRTWYQRQRELRGTSYVGVLRRHHSGTKNSVGITKVGGEGTIPSACCWSIRPICPPTASAISQPVRSGSQRPPAAGRTDIDGADSTNVPLCRCCLGMTVSIAACVARARGSERQRMPIGFGSCSIGLPITSCKTSSSGGNARNSNAFTSRPTDCSRDRTPSSNKLSPCRTSGRRTARIRSCTPAQQVIRASSAPMSRARDQHNKRFVASDTESRK